MSAPATALDAGLFRKPAVGAPTIDPAQRSLRACALPAVLQQNAAAVSTYRGFTVTRSVLCVRMPSAVEDPAMRRAPLQPLQDRRGFAAGQSRAKVLASAAGVHVSNAVAKVINSWRLTSLVPSASPGEISDDSSIQRNTHDVDQCAVNKFTSQSSTTGLPDRRTSPLHPARLARTAVYAGTFCANIRRLQSQHPGLQVSDIIRR